MITDLDGEDTRNTKFKFPSPISLTFNDFASSAENTGYFVVRIYVRETAFT